MGWKDGHVFEMYSHVTVCLLDGSSPNFLLTSRWVDVWDPNWVTTEASRGRIVDAIENVRRDPSLPALSRIVVSGI